MSCAVHHFVLCPLCSLAPMWKPFLYGIPSFIFCVSLIFYLDLKLKITHCDWFLPFGWLSGAFQVSSYCFGAVIMSCMCACCGKEEVKLKLFLLCFFSFLIFGWPFKMLIFGNLLIFWPFKILIFGNSSTGKKSFGNEPQLDIDVVVTNHEINDYQRTRGITTNCNYVVLFPYYSLASQMRLMMDKIGVSKEDQKQVLKYKGRDVIFRKTAPLYCVMRKKIFLLRK